MRRTVQRALIIALVGTVLGLAANAVSPRRIPYVMLPQAPPKAQDTVTLAEARELWSGGATFFLDARAPADYAAGHIAGAVSLPAEEFDDHYPQVAAMLTPSTII